MTRMEVLNQIEALLAGCRRCNIPGDILKQYRGHFAKADKYCLKECPVGQKLKELGKQLNKKKAPFGAIR